MGHQPDRMGQAFACFGAFLRSALEVDRGTVVKATSYGVHTTFRDLRDAIVTAIEFGAKRD